jgi:putative transposase
MRIIAYVLMPNHWHLLLYPREDKNMPDFMRWLSTTHATKFRSKTKTVGTGHLYQGRYKSFLVDTDAYLLTAVKYIERNPVRAKLVTLSEEWKWGSAYRRIRGTKKEQLLLAPSPVPLPYHYRAWINESEQSEELDEIRKSVQKGTPFGGEKFLTQFNQLQVKKLQQHI